MNDSTLSEILLAYRQECPEDAQKVESAIRRFILVNFGLQLSGDRASKHEIQLAEQLMLKISTNELTEQKFVVLMEKGFELAGLEKNQQRAPRSYLKKFLNFLEQKQPSRPFLVLTPPPIGSRVLTRKKVKKVVDKSYLEDSRKKKTTGVKIRLTFNSLEYLSNYRQKFPNCSEESLLNSIDTQLNRINNEVNNCLIFLSNRDKDKLEKFARESWLEKIKVLLGWQYHQEQDLEKVGFYYMMPPININPCIANFDNVQDFFLAKGKANYEAKNVGNQVIKFFQDFFMGYGGHYKNTSKAVYINAGINIAKFVNKDITDNTESLNYEDIAVVRKLRVLRGSLPKDPNKIKELPLNWEEILQIRAEFKKRVDDEFLYKDVGTKIYKFHRRKSAISTDFQKFLILCFLTVVPPIRRRSIAELELGRTLKYGLFDNSGFTPFEYLKEGQTARYYYHFNVDDYKTGQTYGEFIAELPNKDLGDGTYFYDYLNKWLYGGYRDILLRHQQTHKCLFVKIYDRQYADERAYFAGDPIGYGTFSGVVGNLTKKYTGVTLHPHIFRTIYRTYLVNKGASSAELEAAAFFMQHSEEMARKTYTVQTILEKLNPVYNMFSRLNI